MPFGSNNFSVESNGIFLMSAAFFSSFLFSFKCLIDKWNIFDFENNGPILSNRDSGRTKIWLKTKHTNLLQLLTIISIVSKSKLLLKYKHLILLHWLRIDFKLFWFSFELTFRATKALVTFPPTIEWLLKKHKMRSLIFPILNPLVTSVVCAADYGKMRSIII
jgi:hypothetical protein